MSFLKKLFGGGDGPSGGADKALGSEEYKGYRITAVEMKQGGEYILSGTVEKDINGEVQVHKFIRADRLSSPEQAASFALSKGRQLVDEQGDGLFR